jgi:hypothetical protein
MEELREAIEERLRNPPPFAQERFAEKGMFPQASGTARSDNPPELPSREAGARS